MGRNKQIAIIGYGFVGKATHLLISSYYEGSDVQIHDPAYGYKIEDWTGIDYAFICVPTNLWVDPQKELTGSAVWPSKLDISIVEDVLSMLPNWLTPVIRSTIGPDQALSLTRKYGAIIMPEFLREDHWQEDVLDLKIPIVVGAYPSSHQDFLLWIKDTRDRVLNKKVWVVNPGEASAIKMFRNAALAVNAGLANEFKEICDVYDLDYRDVKDFFMQDKTLGTHWQVPGPDGKVGFGGTCLPKDLTHSSSLCYSSDSIMKTAIAANKIRRKDGKSNRQD